MGEPDFSVEGGHGNFHDGVTSLSPHDAFDFARAGVMIVDLREAYETNFRVFAVDNVIYLPWSRFQEGRGSLPRDRALIFADAAGLYGKEAAKALIAEGWTNVASLAGGMIDWDADGLPVRKDTEYELGGQCACKLKTRHGGNPLLGKDQG